MLDNKVKEQLRAYFTKLVNPVILTASSDASKKSQEMLGLLKDLTGLSDKITLAENGNSPRAPSFTVNRPDGNCHIEFAGLPMGHEFTSLILAILQTGGYPPKVEADVIEQIRQVEGSFQFETYISLTCQNCPEVVQALNLMAVLNPNISSTMIDGALFQDEVKERQIMAVPTIYLNGKEFGQGRMNVKEILAKIDTGSVKREAEKISAKAPFDVLVIGGGSAAATAAIYAARKGIRTGLVTENFGGQILNTTDIENIIAIKKIEGTHLASIYEENIRSHAIDVMMPQRAVKLIPGDLIEVQLESGASVKSKTVILATGATWRKMAVPGEETYIGKGVAFCPHCDGPLYKGKDVAVIGGGNSAVEAAIDLAGIANHVSVLIRSDRLTADTILQDKMLSLKNVTLIKQAKTVEVAGDGKKVTGIVYLDQTDNTQKNLPLSGIFVQIGQVPTTGWLKDSPVRLNGKQEIEVDVYNRTSVPGIFAAGDATSSPYKQIVIAMGDGAKASLSAFDHLIRH
ncbi:MAG: alkyl hydroperoxide reductase subunit F [Oxalobacter sp.]|nr:alkyl hydroperoxide reductase subunit F [Oxalobacter sp.]